MALTGLRLFIQHDPINWKPLTKPTSKLVSTLANSAPSLSMSFCNLSSPALPQYFSLVNFSFNAN